MATRLAAEIPVRPWFHDHFFDGTSILPAVESMLFLAQIAKEIRPETQVTTLCDGRFLSLLAIPHGAKQLSVLVEYEAGLADEATDLRVRLLSRLQFKKISRLKEHAELRFCHGPLTVPEPPELSANTFFQIETGRIYKELVPFGPSYHSLKGSLQISKEGARGILKAPVPGPANAMEHELGSPFILDGAMHAASVLGQCLTDFVPFPVGFEKRLVHRPTRPGQEYQVIVIPTAQAADELLFTLWISDSEGNSCETVTGLRMRDVSRGRIRPPEDLPSLTFSPQ